MSTARSMSPLRRSEKSESQRLPAIAGCHAKLHRRAGRRHRQIERVLEFDLLRLRQAERAGDVCKRFLCENDCAGAHGPDFADELNVFDCCGEELQTAAILFEKTKTRASVLALDEQPQEPLMAQAGREGKFALRDVERRFCVTQPPIVETRHVFKRRVAHRGVVTIDIKSSHGETDPQITRMPQMNL